MHNYCVNTLTITDIVPVLALMALWGCGPALSRQAETAAPQPPQIMRDAFAGCTWEKVEGATLSIWSYACDAAHGNTRLLADNALPGFRFTDGSVAIRAFEKAANAPVDSILDQVRAASPGPHSDTCALTPMPGRDQGGPQLFVFTPTGAAKAEWDAHAEDLEPPCGVMGPADSGDRYFQALPDHPETVVFVELGSEIQIFDVNTLKNR